MASTSLVEKRAIGLTELQALIELLAAREYRIIGPVLRDGAIVYDDVKRTADLPAGWTDRQEAGHYNVERRDDAALFGYAVGPSSWKRFLHPPLEVLWRARRENGSLAVTPTQPPAQKLAFLGVRACELSAVAIQDRVFMDGPYLDTLYAHRRRDAFIVAVNCADPANTCFCTSMGTGPKAEAGFDLALTELVGTTWHGFVVEVGSGAGAEVLAQLSTRAASAEEVAAAEAVSVLAAQRITRRLDTQGLKEALQAAAVHPHWDDVAARCLGCANCTMVCPTCFCTSVADHSDLAGEEAERVRRWDSCFNTDFSFIHGGPVRAGRAARYRQWITHKLASWIDQFGTSGCVGCGRCIAWCPVGIDIIQEADAIRTGAPGEGHHGGA
ncbi:MAG TPA: 4Fe-4S dicluster domain-containing protein [Rhodopila sp.]|nr:4Fe-4S dicluster domain-containing protein [Rhodopila sp.]